MNEPVAARLRDGRIAALSQFLLGLGFPLVLVVSPRCSVLFLTLAAILAAIELARPSESGPGIAAALAATIRRPAALSLIAVAGLGLASTLWSSRPDFTLERAGQFAGATLAGLIVLTAIAARPGRLLPAVHLGGYFLAALVILGDIATGGHVIALVEGPFHPTHYDRQIFQLCLLALALLALPVSNMIGAIVLGFAAVLAYVGTSQATQVALMVGSVTLLVVWLAPRATAVLAAVAVVASFVLIPLYVPRLIDLLPPSAFALLLEGSPDIRLLFWQHYGERLQEALLVGHGLEASRFVEPIGTIIRWNGETLEYGSPYHPHNAVLQVWYDLGIVGVVVAGVFLLSTLRRLTAWHGAPYMAGMALYCGVFAAAMFANSAWANWRMSTLFIFAAMLARAARAVADERAGE